MLIGDNYFSKSILFIMARAMFEYTKEVLQKVSFNNVLFAKEVKKATQVLLPYELEELKNFILDLIRLKPELETSLIYLDAA